MTIELRVAGDRAEIFCRGALDATAAPAFRAAAEAALAAPASEVVLRAETVTRLDSSGLGAIVFLHRRLALGDRRLRIAGLSGQPLALARLIRLDAMIPGAAAPAAPKGRRGALARLGGILRAAPARAAEV